MIGEIVDVKHRFPDTQLRKLHYFYENIIIMIVLHDEKSTDLGTLQTIADIEEGFALFDYVRIDQDSGPSWIGQIIQPNRNVSIVGGRLDPTILHGLQLMQEHQNIQSVRSVQVFDIQILGEYDGRRLSSARLRPLPGSRVSRLNTDDTINVINLPIFNDDSNISNVVGELLNADGVPLCLEEHKFNYHIMVAGGTGSGKSNVAGNVIMQAVNFNKCVLIHDAKPDYEFVNRSNSDPNPLVQEIWRDFEQYHIAPKAAQNVLRVGLHQRCNPDSIDIEIGFDASDFSPTMLASLFFPSHGEANQYEAFAGAADTLAEEIRDAANHRRNYSVDNILEVVSNRMEDSVDPRIQVHPATGRAVLRKVNNRRRSMPWLDSVGNTARRRNTGRLSGGRLNNPTQATVQRFDLRTSIQRGRVIVIDYRQVDEASYALILSYFLRICQSYRKNRSETGLVQMVDEAHRIFDNESQHGSGLARAFERVMREGRSVDHSIILSLQNASQIPPRVMNNLNTKFVMRQNSKHEADAATQTMGREFSAQSMRLGTGQALVSMFESNAVVLAKMAPSPFDLMRNDNTGENSVVQNQTQINTETSEDNSLPF